MYVSEISRKMHDKFCKGWNTWDVYSVTSHVLLPDKVKLNFSFCIPHMSAYLKDVMWENVKRFGEHSIDGTYSEIEIEYLDGVFQVETSAEGDEFVACITPLKPRRNVHVIIELSSIWGSKITTGYEEKGLYAIANKRRHTVQCLNENVELDWNPTTYTHMVIKLDEPVYIRINSAKTKTDIRNYLVSQREKWLGETIHAEGELGEALKGMRRSLLWNLMYEPRSERAITPVSKNWSNPSMFNNLDANEENDGMLDENGKHGIPQINIHGNYVLFDWDTFFASLMYGLFNKELAYMTAFSALEEMCEGCYVPNASTGNGKVRDRTQPQLGAVCVWKLYIQFGDTWFIKECFPRLYDWNGWRMGHRDFNHDGLLELGAIVPGGWREDEEIWPYIDLGLKWALGCESGLDNSTMWDDAELDYEKKCMKLYYLGVNAEMVLDCEMLEKMAKLLGKEEEMYVLQERRKALTEKIRENLWNDEVGCFMNKKWSGEFEQTLSPTHFYSMTAGIASPEQADCMIGKHLTNKDEFWGEYKLPSTPMNDPRFIEQNYWRGRIWAPLNYLVGEGLIRYGKKDVFAELADNGMMMFLKNWKENSVVGENYNAITGEGGDKLNGSDAFYHWGALMVYIYIQKTINFNPWTDTIDRGVIEGGTEIIHNLCVGDDKITVS